MAGMYVLCRYELDPCYRSALDALTENAEVFVDRTPALLLET